MSKKVNTIICADTIIDGRFDRSLILVPIESIFHVTKKETKVFIFEKNQGGPNPYMGSTTFYMS